MQVITDTFSSLVFGQQQIVHNLCLIPLISSRDDAADYIVLDDALAHHQLKITEVSDSGEVPDLLVDNQGSTPVLLLDGEELVGAKQNRILNLTLLVPAHGRLKIPVSCVEAGRWSSVGREFTTEGYAFFSEGRARKARGVTESMLRRGERHSRQHEVWDDISRKSSRMRVHSSTEAARDLYEKNRRSLDDYLQAFSCLEHQVGGVFLINGRVMGMDLFDSSETFRKLFSKLVRSYALDAIDQKGDMAADPGEPKDAEAFMRKVAQSEVEVQSALGLGDDIRFTGKGLSGGALSVDGKIKHLCAFRLPDTEDRFHGRRLSRPARRMRSRR
ncbi:MAG TPA: hypothetical protein ENJ35_07365 [Gammaproteobacteria bacterium]|nr:hypothetical protein [Gammaproteobacteria bacterium]